MTTLESLQALTDEELIEKVAVEVMGFTKNVRKFQGPRFVTTWLRHPGDFANRAKKWDPLTDWGHWREVEVIIMKSDYFWSRFIEHFKRWNGGWAGYMKADLRTRCIAALLAVTSQTDAPRNAQP